MKHLKQLLLISAMLLGINAWAEDTSSRVTVVKQLNGEGTTVDVGNVSYTVGTSSVEVKVTPKDGYYFTNGDLTVERATDAGNAQARRRTAPDAPSYAGGPEVTPGTDNTLTGTSTFTFPLDVDDNNICYLVTANFHKRVSIAGATVTFKTYDDTYSGSEIKPEVDKVKLADGTEVTYSNVTYANNVNVPTSATAPQPTVTVTGTGKFIGNASQTFTINKADIDDEDITLPTGIENLYATGEAQDLIKAGTVANGIGTMEYSLDGKDFSTDIPTGTDAGEYTIYYRILGDANHNDVEAQQLANPVVILSDADIIDLLRQEMEKTVIILDAYGGILSREVVTPAVIAVNDAILLLTCHDNGEIIPNDEAMELYLRLKAFNDQYGNIVTGIENVNVNLNLNLNGNGNVNGNDNGNCYYDMQGRRVLSPRFSHLSPLRKGLYIVNGKKVVIR